jgi:serine phosphatase RsbU (regulator of sigma subunit)
VIEIFEEIDIHEKLKTAGSEQEKADLLNRYSWKIRHSFPNKALDFALKARELSANIDYKSGVAYSFRCSGAAYSLVSQFQIGLADLQKAFVLFFELGNKQAIATTLRNIGNIYKALNQIEKSLEHYYNALRFAKEVDDQQGVAYIYGYIGDAKFMLQNYDMALDFMYRAIEIHSERGDDFGLANSYIILGNIYLATDQHQKAFGYILQAINKSNKINHLRGIADANSSLGNFYRDQKNYAKALYQHQIAMSAATEMGEKLLISGIYKNISETYKASGNFEKALETYTRYDEVKSIVQNANNEITVRTLQAQFELEQSEKEKEIYKFKNIELANANKLIESKNKDITDSIKYAKHIQEAILPERNYMKQYLQDFFIFYKPKDIVSGDFYWFLEKNGLLYIAAVDCTGHGVPGAFVSIVGGNILNQVVRQNDFTDASEILNSVNNMFNMSIRQTFEESVVKDGMDLVLCVIDKEKMIVNFAGAYNPLYIVRDNEINIYKGNKFPIGTFIGDEVKKFSSQNIPIQKNDVLYLFSDGYVDQFGGNENKKLMHKRFRDLILENTQLPMKLQHYNFELYFENWKGNREQVDDILLIGLRIQ